MPETVGPGCTVEWRRKDEGGMMKDEERGLTTESTENTNGNPFAFDEVNQKLLNRCIWPQGFFVTIGSRWQTKEPPRLRGTLIAADVDENSVWIPLEETSDFRGGLANRLAWVSTAQDLAEKWECLSNATELKQYKRKGLSEMRPLPSCPEVKGGEG